MKCNLELLVLFGVHPSRVVNIIKSVHKVGPPLFSDPPPSSLTEEYFENVDFETPSQNRTPPDDIFKKCTVALEPFLPAYAVFARENDDNSG